MPVVSFAFFARWLIFENRDCVHPGVSNSRPYWHDVAEVHPNPHGRSILSQIFIFTAYLTFVTGTGGSCGDKFAL